MKILVTGHRGFIGSQVYGTLCDQGYDVSGIDIGDQFIDRKYDYIVHMGARTLIRMSREKPYEYFDDNMVFSLRMLEYCRKNGSTFIFPTSGSVMEATNPYSLSKKQTVEWIELYHTMYGTRRHVMKFFNIYGPTSRKGAVFLFSKASLTGQEAVIYGDGNNVRDFIHVKDVVRAIRMIIDGKVEEGYHEIGSGVGTSVNDLLKLVEDVTGKKIRTHREDYVLPEARELVASHPLIGDVTPLRKGIEEVVDALRKEFTGTSVP
ncbi:MAG: NAD(P)-dependent oxidoreductase [Thermoplasmataceae archaeon]